MRTVELLSYDFPRQGGGLKILPTTLQAYGHGISAYARNTLKRGAWSSFGHYLVNGPSRDWPRVVRTMLPEVIERGGVFHLWGHSWEIEQTGQWRQLEEALQWLGQFTRQAPALTNSQICHAIATRG